MWMLPPMTFHYTPSKMQSLLIITYYFATGKVTFWGVAQFLIFFVFVTAPCWQKIALGFIQSLRQAEESRQTVKEGLVCVYCPLQKYLTSGFQGSSSSGPGHGNTTLKRDKEKIKSWAVNTYSLAPLFTKLCLPPTVLWDKLNTTLWKALVLHIQMLKHYIMHCLLALLPHNILIWKLFTLMNNFDFISYGQCHQKRKKMLSECKLFMS